MNDFLKTKPSSMKALKALLRADFIVQWKQRRSMFMSLLVPIIFLFSFRSLIPIVGGPSVLAICISVGLPAVGLLGYSALIARDRERGVFQRLRTAPISTWTIMVSRILVQLAVMAGVTLITIIVGAIVDHIHVGVGAAIVAIIAAVIGGASFVALAQVIVALVKGSDAVNAVVRLFYSAIAVVGSLGGVGLFGTVVENIVQWSPLGTTKTILAAALTSHSWTGTVVGAFFVTIGYIIVLSAIGIKYFKWSTE
jgi:ABC-2 type transport system permease protein